MKASDLTFQNLTMNILKPYQKRAPTESTQFLRWFLENIFRLEVQDADDACVDNKQDKGVDGLYVNNILETVYVFQSKIRQKENATLGDVDLKEFAGTLKQFESEAAVQALLDGKANNELKSALVRDQIKEKIAAGYTVEGVFCCNVSLNADGIAYLPLIPEISVYDASRIADEYVDLGASIGIKDKFFFNVADTEVIKYQTADGVTARIFLADALQLTHMKGISDQTLFSQNVRLALGNTKVNRSLVESIRNKTEHKNFPLYHNGITVLCNLIDEAAKEKIAIEDYVVVNGAQSLTSLLNSKASITADLRVLVKIVAIAGDIELSEKITHNSNNQNAIKARDQKSNNPIQKRLKKEVADLKYENFVLEVKQGELNQQKSVLVNEDAGLALLAIDLGEPWSCHQKYKVMDDSHAKIFGRPDVTGAKLVFSHLLIEAMSEVLGGFEDQVFGHYNLTKFFLAHAVSEICKEDPKVRTIFENPIGLFSNKKIYKFLEVFKSIAATTVDDLNAEVNDLKQEEKFDHKRDLKSPTWCKSMAIKLVSAYKKDVKRKKATAIGELFAECV
jgi:hypothetical protein